jgi:hypothetical protein
MRTSPRVPWNFILGKAQVFPRLFGRRRHRQSAKVDADISNKEAAMATDAVVRAIDVGVWNTKLVIDADSQSIRCMHFPSITP